DGAQRGPGGEHVGFGEHGHQRDESAVAAAIYAHALRVNAVLGHQIFHGVYVIAQILAAHVPVDRRAPIAPVARRGPVIDVHYDEAAFHQQVVEHVFAVITAPPLMDVLQITRAMNEERGGAALLPFRGLVETSWDLHAVARFERDYRRIDPVVSEELVSRRG